MQSEALAEAVFKYKPYNMTFMNTFHNALAEFLDGEAVH